MPRGGPIPKTRANDRRGGGAPGERGQARFVMREGEREKVAEYARVLTVNQIALVLRGPNEPLHRDTLTKYFGPELLWGRANFIAEAGGKLYDAVLAGKESSIHFALKVLGEPGQFVERRELTGPGGGPIQTVDISALAGLSDEELADLERAASIVARLAGERPDGPAIAPDQAGPDSERDSAPSA